MRQALKWAAVGPALLCRAFLSIAIATVFIAASAPNAAANPKYASIVIDAKTGKTLYASAAESRRYPASLTKMMTLYMVFDALASKRISKSSKITISNNAAAEQPSKLGLKPGATITVENAILAMVTKSANDVATATGEFLGGSEAKFARMMTQKAHALGMRSTTFRNAHGLPNDGHVSTAHDMARLGLALREHFPQYYGYFSTRSFSYAGKRYGNHNRLLGRVKGIDGIKTGYTRAAGFNLVSSIETNGRSIVAVVMGGKTGRSRDAHMAELIAKYLPRASRSGGGDLIAQPKSIESSLPVAASAGQFILPGKDAPTPDSRPVNSIDAQQPIEVAALAPIEVPQPFPAQREELEPAQGDVDMVETSSTIPDGWVVQVASLTSEAEAQEFLDRTSRQAGRILSSAVAFTQKFDKDGIQYYRARFGGFASKNAARNTCDALKGHDINCYAVQQ